MTRHAHHIFKVHIADGFANDCDELIHKCLQLQTLDYQTFCNFWKDFNFGLIYTGRTSGAEIAELSEEVIHIAKHYMVKDTSNVEESIAGLFLVYGLVQLQPYSGFACLRIVPDDLPAINKIETVARRERRLDVLYILGHVLITCSQYHAANRERGLEPVLRKYLEGYTSIDKLGVRPKGVFLRQNVELDIIRDLGSVTRQYARAKKSLIDEDKPDPSLRYINENLANELNISLKKVINGLVEINPDSNDDEESEEYDHYNSVQTIKQKAMSNTGNSIQNLQGTSNEGIVKSPSKPKSDLQQTTGKVKTVSPNKPVTSAPKKHKGPDRKGKGKNMKKNLNLSDQIEINLDSFSKAINVDSETNEQNIAINAEDTSVTEFLTTETADKIADSDIDVTSDDDSDDSGTSVNVDQIFGSDEVREMAHVQTKAPLDLSKVGKRTRRDIDIINPIVRKKERRDCKRIKIKSKFKKMGMLSLANFKELS